MTLTVGDFRTSLHSQPGQRQLFPERSVPRLLVWYAVGGWVSQWRRDVHIWEGKGFSEPPTLCRDDGPMMRLRRWYRQLFPALAASGRSSTEQSDS